MGRSSGRAGSGSFQEQMSASEFTHTLSGVRYQVSKQREGFTLAYDQKQPAGSPEIRGTQQLTYFIGSGNVGRSYLFSVMGFLFQAPVSYYARSSKWDLAPGYQQHSELFLMRPVEAECLECHASGVQAIPGTQNGYKDVPFLEGRISCERCHGPGRSHIAGAHLGSVSEPAGNREPGKAGSAAPRQCVRPMPSIGRISYRQSGSIALPFYSRRTALRLRSLVGLEFQKRRRPQSHEPL